jgi:hypothetical protein
VACERGEVLCVGVRGVSFTLRTSMFVRTISLFAPITTIPSTPLYVVIRWNAISISAMTGKQVHEVGTTSFKLRLGRPKT